MRWVSVPSKKIKTICKRTFTNIFAMYMNSSNVILVDKRVNIAIDTIDILHHSNYTMNDDEFVSDKFLGPPFKLVNTTIIFNNLFDGVTIAHPVKQCNP